MNTNQTSKKKRPTRRPKAVDVTFVQKAAQHYLERFDASERKLTEVLQRRASKAAKQLDEDERPGVEQIEEWVGQVVQRYVQAGLVSDARFAENLCRSFRLRGMSSRAILQRVRQKGVSEDVVIEALERVDADSSLDSGNVPQGDHSEFSAAQRFAKRRRLGPHRSAEKRAERREKDLAALARAGFSYDVARRVLDSDGDG